MRPSRRFKWRLLAIAATIVYVSSLSAAPQFTAFTLVTTGTGVELRAFPCLPVECRPRRSAGPRNATGSTLTSPSIRAPHWLSRALDTSGCRRMRWDWAGPIFWSRLRSPTPNHGYFYWPPGLHQCIGWHEHRFRRHAQRGPAERFRGHGGSAVLHGAWHRRVDWRNRGPHRRRAEFLYSAGQLLMRWRVIQRAARHRRHHGSTQHPGPAHDGNQSHSSSRGDLVRRPWRSFPTAWIFRLTVSCSICRMASRRMTPTCSS